MCVLGSAPITGRKLARKISNESDANWDANERSIKNLLVKMGAQHNGFCHLKGLPQGSADPEWLLDLVWMDTNSSAILLAVESEVQLSEKA